MFPIGAGAIGGYNLISSMNMSRIALEQARLNAERARNANQNSNRSERSCYIGTKVPKPRIKSKNRSEIKKLKKIVGPFDEITIKVELNKLLKTKKYQDITILERRGVTFLFKTKNNTYGVAELRNGKIPEYIVTSDKNEAYGIYYRSISRRAGMCNVGVIKKSKKVSKRPKPTPRRQKKHSKIAFYFDDY